MPRSLHPLVPGCQMCQRLVPSREATKYFLTVANKTQSWHVSFNKCAFQCLMLWLPNQPKQQERRISVFPERMQQWVTISALLWVTSTVLLNGWAMNMKWQNIPFALEITGKSPDPDWEMSVVQACIQIRISPLLLLIFMMTGSREELKHEATGL